jgi:hypothetical protein
VSCLLQVSRKVLSCLAWINIDAQQVVLIGAAAVSKGLECFPNGGTDLLEC